ncbi:GNAT family N-acetyltransferase [Cellulomonas marina]|uniref:Protein N-acetyltransferase, RimJ/RimL family n=1 Tax=Cellulomonas marina TaxID=988821 RepID=A0A1I0W501_9CELL|nr:GNAT family N-acetyltransferase [Cellulomonas marina]GIG29973.1 hypothetical protein Cma02nite_25730 [Cellulomonas marina]SFA83300.1 Protein N-acetyltransferase, RimJ/RimL family [Cellulomonas marina]
MTSPSSSEQDLLRPMVAEDVDDVLDVQEPGAVRGLADVFPQDLYPFPRDHIGRRWRQDLLAPDVDCLVVVLEERVVGFAALRHDELLHLGIAVEHWGTGLAQRAHDAVLARLRDRGVTRAWLTVYTGNRRARRFYERLGWSPTGATTHGPTPPFAELLRYERALDA